MLGSRVGKNAHLGCVRFVLKAQQRNTQRKCVVKRVSVRFTAFHSDETTSILDQAQITT
jgi:hypothetical protein